MHQALFASGISLIQPMHQFPMNHPELFGMSSPNRRLVAQVLAEDPHIHARSLEEEFACASIASFFCLIAPVPSA